MFKVVDVENYDRRTAYGIEYHTNYVIESDEELSIDEVIEKLTQEGQVVCGQCKLKRYEYKNELILETVMF